MNLLMGPPPKKSEFSPHQYAFSRTSLPDIPLSPKPILALYHASHSNNHSIYSTPFKAPLSPKPLVSTDLTRPPHTPLYTPLLVAYYGSMLPITQFPLTTQPSRHHVFALLFKAYLRYLNTSAARYGRECGYAPRSVQRWASGQAKPPLGVLAEVITFMATYPSVGRQLLSLLSQPNHSTKETANEAS